MNGDEGVNGSWQNYKRSQSQFILLTIRSNLFHANSSLRFQKVLFDINRSGCSCRNPPSATLYFDYAQLTALYSACNGFLILLLHLNEIHVYTGNAKIQLSQVFMSLYKTGRVCRLRNLPWNLCFCSKVMPSNYHDRLQGTTEMCKLCQTF